MPIAGPKGAELAALPEFLRPDPFGNMVAIDKNAVDAEAVKEFTAAIQINENLADLHLALGRNYVVLEQYVQAVEEPPGGPRRLCSDPKESD
jgi:hypothetical protein